MQNVRTVIIALVALLVGIGGTVWLLPRPQPAPAPSPTAQRDDTQVVRAITREQQVVLIGIGIQGIVSEQNSKELWGVTVPGSDRATFVQYSYNAKLGLDGQGVRVERTGEQAYRITVPEFRFIGHDQTEFKVAAEHNGLLSWTTPEIDEAAMITQVLNDGTKAQHVNDHRALLEEQARVFYSGIVHGIEPDAQIEFVFERSA